MKLNIGAGDCTIPGFESIDIKNGVNAEKLPYADGSVDEVYASHILEHFPYFKTGNVLREWVRVLKPGGRISIAVPDIDELMKVREHPEMGGGMLHACVMGGHTDDNDRHGRVFWREGLVRMLMACGIEAIVDFQPFANDCTRHSFSLNLTGVKRPAFAIKAAPKVAMVCSQPRISFSTTYRKMLETVRELGEKHGFPFVDANGQSWDQALQNGIQKAIVQHNPDYILTVDFDGAFEPADVERMIAHMQSRPDLAACFPIQMSRHDDMPLVFQPQLDYSTPLTDCVYGHFGLTLIRPEVLANIPMPWFYPIPSPEGRYDTPAHSDTDITFWRELNARGYKIAQANDVLLGHIVLSVKWPTMGGAAFQEITNYERGGKPKAAAFHGSVFNKIMHDRGQLPRNAVREAVTVDPPLRMMEPGGGNGDPVDIGNTGSGVHHPDGEGVRGSDDVRTETDRRGVHGLACGNANGRGREGRVHAHS